MQRLHAFFCLTDATAECLSAQILIFIKLVESPIWHGIAYQTARTDLLALSDEYQLLKKYKVAKKDVFVAPPDLLEIIKAS